MTLSNAELEAIEARAKATTPGKWRSDSELPYARKPRVHSSEDYLIAEIGNAQVEHQDWWEADSEFIANAKQDIPALLTALRERDAEIAGLREALVAGIQYHQQMGIPTKWGRDVLAQMRAALSQDKGT